MTSYLIRRLALLCALSLCLPQSFAEASPNALATVSIAESVTDISDAFSYLEDPEGKLQPEDILNSLGSFKRVAAGGANFGLTQTPYWFALWVKSEHPDSTLVMDITYALFSILSTSTSTSELRAVSSNSLGTSSQETDAPLIPATASIVQSIQNS